MIVIADAAGKGISACLYSLMLRSMLRSCATEDDLSTLICHANNLFCLDTGESGFFATAWVGIYNADTHLLQYASCGHHPAMLHRATGRIEELITKGIALGVTPLEKMETAEVLLHAGDTLLLYTDGVLEAHNPASTLFGKYRLHQLIEAHADGSAKQLVSQLLNEVSLFCEKTPQHDDITVLALKLT
jgi:sigma-B regulation protein RsbU (phosphoserine phosphatase)